MRKILLSILGLGLGLGLVGLTACNDYGHCTYSQPNCPKPSASVSVQTTF